MPAGHTIEIHASRNMKRAAEKLRQLSSAVSPSPSINALQEHEQEIGESY
jgi:hypothetical protein